MLELLAELPLLGLAGALAAGVAAFYALSRLTEPPALRVGPGVHVMVTGGSSGIGKAVAKIAMQRGAHVTIVARNKAKLAEAREELEQCRVSEEQQLLDVSVDVSGDYSGIEAAIEGAMATSGGVDVLVNSAGISNPAAFEDVPVDGFERLYRVNVLGSIFATRVVLPRMRARGRGRVVFVSSQAGQVGLFGFTNYSASKFALRGFAESLQMENRAYGVYVSLSFPPDTDTPLLERENQTKPVETALISETSGLFSADRVARDLVEGLQRGKFFIYTGLDGWMLSNLTCGMSPVHSLWDAAVQVATASLFRLVSLFYLASFNRIVKKAAASKVKSA